MALVLRGLVRAGPTWACVGRGQGLVPPRALSLLKDYGCLDSAILACCGRASIVILFIYLFIYFMFIGERGG